MTVSFQIYSARGVSDQHGFLKTLAGLGYAQVEGYGGVLGDAAGYRAALDDAGLKMPSTHMGLDMLEDDFGAAEKIVKTLGIGKVFAPHLAEDQRPTDAAGWVDFSKRLEAVNQRAVDAGFSFGWHNHDFEFVALSNGETPMQIMLDNAPSIAWEGDLAWIARANVDISAFVEKNGHRLQAIHVKDIAPAGECDDEDGWADVGHGTLPWSDLVAQVRRLSPDALMVMEHDKPSDALRFATRSISAFKDF